MTTQVDASSLHVGESLLMNYASLGDVVGLGDAKIDGLLDLSDASAERLDAPSLRVGENLDLRGARISKVILGDAVVGGYIKVGAKDDEPTIKELDLHNARAGSLLDTGEKSWPTKMRLDGFTFSRFGKSTMAKRDRAWWDNWAHSDESKSSYPYEQLAVAHAAAGDRNAADAFHYAERVRAAENADWGERALSYVLGWGAGYGIGYYMFRALGWALLLAVIGTLVLRFLVKGVRDETGKVKHGSFWCFGASVDRLLPFITLKKEFSEFFDDRHSQSLHARAGPLLHRVWCARLGLGSHRACCDGNVHEGKLGRTRTAPVALTSASARPAPRLRRRTCPAANSP